MSYLEHRLESRRRYRKGDACVWRLSLTEGDFKLRDRLVELLYQFPDGCWMVELDNDDGKASVEEDMLELWENEPCP